MFKKIWDFMGSLRFAFWILISVMLTFFIGKQLFLIDYDLFNELNRMTVQAWFAENFAANAHFAWWIPLLFITMTLLAVNTFICTWNRVSILMKARPSLTAKRFMVLLTPSIVHVMFIVILFGHFVTFTCGSWNKHVISEGTEFTVGTKNLKVVKIVRENFPETSKLNHMLKQITVSLADSQGKNYQLSFLDPISVDGKHLLLGKKKKKNIPRDCSEEGDKFMFRAKNNQSDLFLTVISDPGIYFIVGGFLIIMLFMPWYFYQLSAGSKQE